MVEIENFIFEVNNYGQDLIADSSGVAELYALNSSAKDGLGVKVILTEMGFKIELKLLTDSSAARAMCMRVGHSAKTKHLEIKTLFLQQLVKQKRLTVGKIDTHRNKADVGTKHFDVQRLNYLKRRLGRAKNLAELFDNEGEQLPELNSIESSIKETAFVTSNFEMPNEQCMNGKWAGPLYMMTGTLITLTFQYVIRKLRIVYLSVKTCLRRKATNERERVPRK